MNEKALLQEIEEDLQKAPEHKVLYLEGKTDAAIFFGLLGVTAAADDVHQGVLVRGLSSHKGSGNRAVTDRVASDGAPGAEKKTCSCITRLLVFPAP